MYAPSILAIWPESSLFPEDILDSWQHTECTAKTLTRLRGCTGWSESSLGHMQSCRKCCAGLVCCCTRCEMDPDRICFQRRPIKAVHSLRDAHFDQNLCCQLTESMNNVTIIDTEKALIRLCGCAGWSRHSLIAYGIRALSTSWAICVFFL